MTVQNLIVKNIASGNGSTTQWPFTFACPVDHPEYIKVYIKGASGKATATTDFSVNMTNKYVTYPVTGSVLASGEKIIIARELPLHQILNLVNQGPFYAEDLEVTYDELVMMIQQLNEQLGRSLKVGVDIDSDSDIDVTIPVPTDNDVHSLVLDKNGFKLFSNPGDAADYAAAAQNAASVAEAKSVIATAQANIASQKAIAITDSANQIETNKNNIALLKTYVTPEMFGAKGDGVTDDRNAFNLAIQAGNCLVLDGKKTYLISSHHSDITPTRWSGVSIVKDNFTVFGNGATLKVQTESTGYYTLLACYNASNIILKDLVLIGDREDEGSSESSEYGMCLGIYGCTDVMVDNCTMLNSIGDGIVLSSLQGASSELCKNIKIINCNISHCKRNGISIINADGVTVHNCNIKDIYGAPMGPWACIDIEPNNNIQYCKNVVISNCILDNDSYNGVAVDGNNNGGTLQVKMINNILSGVSFRIKYSSDNNCLVKGGSCKYMSFILASNAQITVEDIYVHKHPNKVAFSITEIDQSSKLNINNVFINCSGTVSAGNGTVPFYVYGDTTRHNLKVSNVIIDGGLLLTPLYYNSSQSFDNTCEFHNIMCNHSFSGTFTSAFNGSVFNIINNCVYTIPSNVTSYSLRENKYITIDDNSPNSNSIYLKKGWLCDGVHYIINQTTGKSIYVWQNTDYKINIVFNGSLDSYNRFKIATNEIAKITYDSKTNTAFIEKNTLV